MHLPGTITYITSDLIPYTDLPGQMLPWRGPHPKASAWDANLAYLYIIRVISTDLSGDHERTCDGVITKCIPSWLNISLAACSMPPAHFLPNIADHSFTATPPTLADVVILQFLVVFPDGLQFLNLLRLTQTRRPLSSYNESYTYFDSVRRQVRENATLARSFLIRVFCILRRDTPEPAGLNGNNAPYKSLCSPAA